MLSILCNNFAARLSSSSGVSDVYDGLKYKRQGFLKSCNNISFIVNTDGVAIFRSSKKSLWPVWLVVNELPPSERFV